MHPDRAHATDVAIAEKILQIAQPWREPALGGENGLHTSFCRKVDQFKPRSSSPASRATRSTRLPRSDRCAYRFLVLRTCREHEDDVDVWMANQFIDRSDDMPDTKVSAADCAASRRWLVDSRHFILRHKTEHADGPFKAQFPTPIRPTRMIVWLADGALLSAIVDEVDMGLSCLSTPMNICG